MGPSRPSTISEVMAEDETPIVVHSPETGEMIIPNATWVVGADIDGVFILPAALYPLWHSGQGDDVPTYALGEGLTVVFQ